MYTFVNTVVNRDKKTTVFFGTDSHSAFQFEESHYDEGFNEIQYRQREVRFSEETGELIEVGPNYDTE